MTAENWPLCFRTTLRHEGGYVDHPADPGGATNLGVTVRTLSAWLGRQATKAEVRALTPAAVTPIYRRNYWDRIRGDDLPSGIDLVTYDAAVNSGVARAARWTQAACGARADGVVGPLTLSALRRMPPETVVRIATDRRLSFLQGLRIWRVFGRGWARRVGEIRAAGLAMAGCTSEQIAAAAAELGRRGGRDARRAAGAGAGGAIAGGGPLAADQAVSLGAASLALLAVVTVALVAMGIFLAARSRARREASAAMLDHLKPERTHP